MSYNSTTYNEHYYQSHCGKCYGRGNGWEEIFARQAAAIQRDFHPHTVLDVGCAAGYLVEGLRDLGVEAYGMDISEYALSKVREDIRPYCFLQSAAEPIEGTYDMITCIEVLEHLDSMDIREAVKNMCQAAEVIIFSSTPFDYGEETHHSVNEPGYWAQAFAAHGFYHEIGYDCSYISVQAMVFCKRTVTIRSLVREYENKLFLLWNQCCILRDKNNLSMARIADLDAGNIQHAQRMQECEGNYRQKISDMQSRQEQDRKACREEIARLRRMHTQLIQVEYEKRDALEAKLIVLRAEKQALKEEISKYRSGRSVHSDMRLTSKHKLSSAIQKLEERLRYWVKTRKLLKKPVSYWDPVFHAQQYADANPDIQALLGTDEKKLLRHFILHGMEEGRKSSEKFDVYAYLMCNADVEEAFGKRKRDCYIHYIEFGRKEGRSWW